MTVSAGNRYKVPRKPCPICGGGDNLPRGHGRRCSGFTSSDGEFAHCSREEQAGSLPIEGEGTYAHLLRGDCKCGLMHNPAPYVEEARTGTRRRAEIETTYDYVDEGGDLLFQVVRLKGKEFRQRKPDGTGGWEWKLNGVRRVPYRFTELLAAASDKPIVIAEGEKDVDRLRSLGALATCNPGGADAISAKKSKWEPIADDMRIACAGRSVYVVADADDVGRKHARRIADILLGFAARIFVKEPPSPFKDVSEMLDGGGKWADLIPIEGGWGEAPAAPPPPPRDPPPPPPGSSAPDHDGLTADHTDLRNSEHIVEWHGDRLRYIGTWEKWLAWDSFRWNMDDLGRAYECAKDVSRRLFASARTGYTEAGKEMRAAMEGDDEAKKAKTKGKMAEAEADLKHAMKSQGSGRLGAMLDVAKSDPKLVLRHETLDSDLMLLNVANGTLDLRTGTLREHRQTDLLTKLTTVPYDPKALAPTWEAFLRRAMAGNEDLVSFLQRAIGYSLTGTVHEHALFFFHGGGANGKSTFLGTLHSMLGDYATPAPRGLLFRSHNERHPTELATLHGRRFVTCSEIEEGQAFDEALVKDLTGGDPVSARRMREDFWSFSPTHKLFISGQHKPIVRGDDEGIWRRMRLIPFTVTIPEAERDPRLPEKLRAELPGILAWAVRGCLDWLASGLRAPAAVSEATSRYRDENDVLGQFLRERVRVDPGATVPRAELRSVYESWCKEVGAEPVGARRLAGRLREIAARDGVQLGETTMRITMGGATYTVNAWRGLRFQTDAERVANKPN